MKKSILLLKYWI